MLLIVAVLVAAATGGVVWFTRRGWLVRRRSERLIVHTTDGQTIDGTLRDVGPDGLVLLAPRLVDADVALAGDVFIPKAKVLMVQRPSAGGH